MVQVCFVVLLKTIKAFRFFVIQKDYDKVLEEIRENQETTLETRERLAAKVFRHTARYDAMIADYLTKKHMKNSQKV